MNEQDEQLELDRSVRRVWAIVAVAAALFLIGLALQAGPSSSPAHTYSTPSYQQR